MCAGHRGPRGPAAPQRGSEAQGVTGKRLECTDRGSRSRDGVPRGLEDKGYDDRGSKVVGLGKD